MPVSTIEAKETTTEPTQRIQYLKSSVNDSQPGVCVERAIIYTNYFRNRENNQKAKHVQLAEALRDTLLQKTTKIYDHELIVGNFSSKRVGGSIYPELHGMAVMEDIFSFSTRKVNPLQISTRETWQLLKIIPFWSTRFLGFKAYSSLFKKAKIIVSQMTGRHHIINETGGISHIAPDYEKLVNQGTDAIVAEAASKQREVDANSDSYQFYEGVKIICQALADFATRYANLAEEMAENEDDAFRRDELLAIARSCRSSMADGASNFREALQCTFLAQIALNLESLDNAVCPGRIDQYLLPFYEADIAAGDLTREHAKELLAAFSIKMSELIPVFSERITRIFSGMFSGQVVTVGGVDKNGNDATNELSYLFLEVMDELRMRQPNYHARLHANAPADYRNRIYAILADGGGNPALYNDEVIIDTMCQHGYSIEDARNYTPIGCVEPGSQGKSFASTDAALFNTPIVLELALNEGRLFGDLLRSGAKTPPVSQMHSFEDVLAAFRTQLSYLVGDMIEELQAIEIANRDYHPTPLTSALLDGCLANGKCSTAGGAAYNYSGIQPVGSVDAGDALYAIKEAVFTNKRLSLIELKQALENNLEDKQLRAYLRSLGKFGNDDAEVDKHIVYVIDCFREELMRYQNTRGGAYVPGLYSVSAHYSFGRHTGALPHGRQRGECFSSGIAPGNGMDRKGPTALLNSINRIDFHKIANGVNFNLKFDAHSLRGQTGRMALASSIATYFKRGGMQTQINVLDPRILVEARDNPEAYPNLLVRVSGYSAYFNDLTPEMQDELISRSNLEFQG